MIITHTTSAIDLQAKLFRGFADPSRLSILEALRDGERTVGDLVQTTGLTQPNVSNHLACLRDCGLVALRQQGRFAYYSLSDDRVAQLLLLADELLADVARGVYECTRYDAPTEKHNGLPTASRNSHLRHGLR
jgi:ArsR family transcriptional regulator, cadmium/lead-responsive transcriptional repressor